MLKREIRKRIISIICLSVFMLSIFGASFSAVAAVGDNLVVNGNFENGKTGWSSSGLQIGTSGGGYFRANGTSTADAWLWLTSSVVTQSVTLTAGKQYTLSAKLTTFNAAQQQGIVGVKDSNGNVLKEVIGDSSCSSSFVTYSKTLVIVTSGTYTVYFKSSNPSSSSIACFDDIALIDNGAAPTYAATATAGTGGTIINGNGNFIEGSTVSLSASPNMNYAFSSWEVISGGVTIASLSSASTTYVMPANSVEVKANFVSNASGLVNVPQNVKTYPYYVDPQDYPEYNKRPYHTMNWTDFNNSVQFVAGRQWPSATLDASRTVKGTVWRPNLSYVNSAAQSGMQYIKDNGYYLHNIGGYGPGAQFTGSYGNLYTPNWFYGMLTDLLPTKFTGMDIGEHDQRLNFDVKKAINPLTTNKKINFLDNRKYMNKVSEDQGDWGSLLSCLWFWQYPAKDNQAYLLGAETQNKVANSQFQYSNIRGAGKQYGILWYGDTAFCDAVYKTYTYDSGTGTFTDNGKGGSPSFLKRSYYYQYAYNSTILSLESGWTGGWATSTGPLTPVGLMHNDTYEMAKDNPRPGVMHTPVAMLNDFYQGFMPARQIANTLQTWNKLPYESGDYLTDALYSMFYPEYEDSGYFQNEQGAVCNTPYGDSLDTLLTDARAEVLKQYPVIYAASNMTSADSELVSKVESYVQNGGNFVVTADNAKLLWPSWYNAATKVTYPANTAVTWTYGNQAVTETNDFEVYQNLSLPSGYYVDAKTSDNNVVVAEIGMGNGRVILINSPYGLNKTQLSFNYTSIYGPTVQQQADNIQADGTSWKDMGRPYKLSNFAKVVYEKFALSQQLFTLTDDQNNTNFSGKLQYVVDVLGNNQYTVTVINNTTKTKYFNINSQVGQITNNTEVSTFRDMTKENWYGSSTYFSYGIVPLDVNGNAYTDTAARVADATSSNKIFAGDVRVFKITVDPNTGAVKPVETMSKITINNSAANKYLAVKDFSTIYEQISLNPTFFEKFEGIKIDWNELKNIDKNQLTKIGPWVKRNKLKILVDFSSGFAGGKLTLNFSTDPNSAYCKTIKAISDVLDKLTLLNTTKDIVISTDGQTADNTAVQAIADIASKASIVGAKVMYADQTNTKAIQIVNQVNLSNVLVKLNAATNYQQDITSAGSKLGAIYASTGNGQLDYTDFANTTAIKVLDKLYAADSTLADQVYGINTTTLNSLFEDYKSIFVNKSANLAASTAQLLSDTDKTVNPSNIYNTLTLRGIGDLRQAINNTPDFFKYYGAVNVDYKYLLNRDIRQLEAERAWFEAKGIKIVVDFTSDINHYPGLTLVNLVPEDYQRSVNTFNDVMKKMSVIGSTQMIITTHAADSSLYSQMCSNVSTICQTANTYGITVNVSTARNKYNGTYDDPTFLNTFIQNVGSPSNLKIALNLDFLPANPNLTTYKTQCGSLLNLVVYGAPGSDWGGVATVSPFALTSVDVTPISDVNNFKIVSDAYSYSANYVTNSNLTTKAKFALTPESQIPPTTTINFSALDLGSFDYNNLVDLNISMQKLNSQTSSNPNNIVTNGKFQNIAANVLPSGWLCSSFSHISIDYATGAGTGSYWLQNGSRIIKQNLTLQPNTKYHFSIYSKGRGYSNVTAVFGIGSNTTTPSVVTNLKNITLPNSTAETTYTINSFDYTTPSSPPTYGYCVYYKVTETMNTAAGSPYIGNISVSPALSVTSINLDYTDVQLIPQATLQLTADVSPAYADNKTVIWTSSNAAVATVDSTGLVKGISVGTATITATTQDGGFYKTAAVNVLPVKTRIVELNKTSTSILQYQTEQLTANVYPSNAADKTFAWTASNTSIAAVNSSGLVLVSDVGTAIITAAANDGNSSANCEVTVTPIPVSSVSLDITSATLIRLETKQLTATINPSNAYNKSVVWSSSDTAVATVSSSGLVTGLTAGTAVITVTTVDGGKTATCTVTVENTYVKNGGFNVNGSGWSGGNLYIRHDYTPYEGANAGGMDPSSFVYQQINFVAGTQYQLSAYANSYGSANASITVFISTGISGKTPVNVIASQTITPGANNNWQNINFNYTVPAGTQTVYVGFYSNGYWSGIDKISVTN